jgi:hypothetical protein
MRAHERPQARAQLELLGREGKVERVRNLSLGRTHVTTLDTQIYFKGKLLTSCSTAFNYSVSLLFCGSLWLTYCKASDDMPDIWNSCSSAAAKHSISLS